MNSVQRSMRWVPLAAALTTAGGLAAGWLVPWVQMRMFDYVYAVLSPGCFAAICIKVLVGGSDHARWLVPLALLLVVLNVVNHPHTAGLSAIAVAAGAVAVAATICRHKPIAIATTIVCCAGISASLLAALSGG